MIDSSQDVLRVCASQNRISRPFDAARVVRYALAL